jgi:hypothetical protein
VDPRLESFGHVLFNGGETETLLLDPFPILWGELRESQCILKGLL